MLNFLFPRFIVVFNSFWIPRHGQEFGMQGLNFEFCHFLLHKGSPDDRSLYRVLPKINALREQERSDVKVITSSHSHVIYALFIQIESDLIRVISVEMFYGVESVVF